MPRKLYTSEKLTILYILVTVIYMLVFFSKLHNPALFFSVRIAVVTGFGLLVFLSGFRPIAFLNQIRPFLPFLLLGYWYSETFYFSGMMFKNQDAFFCNLDYRMFGCQPSMRFSELLPQRWFSELMYFGYFSLYFFMFGIPLWFRFRRKVHFDRAVFIIISTCLLYYCLFDMLPVQGPQFYFTGSSTSVPDGYVFSEIMRFLQRMGENPTGAFPSSHVGVCTVCLILAYQRDRKLFWILLPMALLLIPSTVYIKAHYLVDVLGGLLSAILFYGVTNSTFNILEKRGVTAYLKRSMQETPR